MQTEPVQIVRNPILRSELVVAAELHFGDNEPADDRIEYDSLINVRPSRNKRSREIEDIDLRQSIRRIVESLVTG